MWQFKDSPIRLPYNLYCVGGDVKRCSIQTRAYTHPRLPKRFLLFWKSDVIISSLLWVLNWQVFFLYTMAALHDVWDQLTLSGLFIKCRKRSNYRYFNEMWSRRSRFTNVASIKLHCSHGPQTTFTSYVNNYVYKLYQGKIQHDSSISAVWLLIAPDRWV